MLSCTHVKCTVGAAIGNGESPAAAVELFGSAFCGAYPL